MKKNEVEAVVACLLLGVMPTYVIPALNRVMEPMTGASAAAALVSPLFTATPANEQLPRRPLIREPGNR